MTQIQNSKRHVLVIEYWSLKFICYLVLEIWNFNAVSRQIGRFILNQSELNLP